MYDDDDDGFVIFDRNEAHLLMRSRLWIDVVLSGATNPVKTRRQVVGDANFYLKKFDEIFTEKEEEEEIVENAKKTIKLLKFNIAETTVDDVKDAISENATVKDNQDDVDTNNEK